jgi:hypothetical protein
MMTPHPHEVENSIGRKPPLCVFVCLSLSTQNTVLIVLQLSLSLLLDTLTRLSLPCQSSKTIRSQKTLSIAIVSKKKRKESITFSRDLQEEKRNTQSKCDARPTKAGGAIHG